MRWFLVLIALAACRGDDPRPASATPPKQEPVVEPSAQPLLLARPKLVRGDTKRYCSDVWLSKDELCACFGRHVGMKSCTYEPLEAGFGIFTLDDLGMDLVVYASDEGMIVIGWPGYSRQHATSQRIVRIGKKPVLWMEFRGPDSGRSWASSVFCPAREPGAVRGIPQCLIIPTRRDTDDPAFYEGSDCVVLGRPVPYVTSRLSVALTRDGYVEVRAVGELHDYKLREYPGRHRLE